MDAAIEDLSRLADQLRLGMLRVRSDHVVEQANEAAHVLLGKRTGSIVGRSVMEAFLDHRAEEAIAGAASGSAGALELDGPEHRRLVLRARADRSRTGSVWVLLEDVTELRRLQRIRAEFIDNLSHELRTPLTTIRLLTERLTDELALLDVPDRVRERVATIDVETGHLVQMVNELLDLSRIEQAATQLHLDDVAVGPLLTAGTARLRAFADRQGVEIRLELPSVPLPPVWGDSERLGQLLLNLLHNAVKFSRAGGVVTVGASQQGLEVVMTVADQGVGIPRADQPRIFERFFKVDRARERGQGGTGLGLAIARHIAEAHRGRIWFESEDGRGSTFFVALPIAGTMAYTVSGVAPVIYLLIAAGGAAGAVSRYLVDDTLTRWFHGAFPIGTLVVNLSGSFVLGILFALVIDRSSLSSDIRAPVMIGFIGAYTTFSTWMLESARLMEDGAWMLAAANLGGSVLLGLLAVFAGLAVGRAL